MNKTMEIKKDMVFEYVDEGYKKYFIPQNAGNDYWTGLVLDENFNIINWAGYDEDTFNNKDYFKLAEKTLDTLWAGDILQYTNGTFQKVTQRTGNIVFLGCYSTGLELSMEDNEVQDTTSIQELKDDGYKLVEDYPKYMEYTGGMLSGLDKVVLKFMEDIEDLKIKK